MDNINRPYNRNTQPEELMPEDEAGRPELVTPEKDAGRIVVV